jgi:apolipoprotein N-acyltransferase
MLRKSDIIMALSSGILLALGFPPLDLYPLAWISIVPLLISLIDKDAKSSFLLGMLAGVTYFLGTIYWVSHSMYVYGNLPLLATFPILILFCLYLSLYIGLFSMLFNYVSNNSRLPALFVVPVLWVTLEYLRTYAFTGFPWAMLGYSQYKLLPLIQIADITGVYGVSFLVAAINGTIFDATISWPKRVGQMPLFAHWPLTLGMILFAFIIVASVLYGIEKLKEDRKGEKIKVSIVQGNIAQDKKWDVRFQSEVINTYKRLTLKSSSNNPDIIVWPETAIPFIFGNNKTLTEELIAFQRQLNTYLLFGSVTLKDMDGNTARLANSAILLSPDGTTVSVYDKIHLVPFGEYVPLKSLFPFVKKLVTAIGDFVKGEETVVMETPFAKIGNLICYEIIFPGLVRKFVERGANVLVTITNDAWFGRTSAPYQHFSMAVFRAVENRVPVVRAANTGISGFIDSKGRITSKSDIFVEAILTEQISVRDSKSFYTNYGDLFAYLCIVSSVLLVIKSFFSDEKRNY